MLTTPFDHLLLLRQPECLLHLKQQPQSVHRPIVLHADHEAVLQQRTTRHGLGNGWSHTQHTLLRLLSTTPSGTANTSQCGNRGNAHGVAEDDSPQRTSPLHSSFEWSPSSPRAAPARRPSPASASAARWLPDRRLLGVLHTRSPAALTQTRTDRPAHPARLGGQPVTGSASCSCFGPSAPSADRLTLSLPIPR